MRGYWFGVVDPRAQCYLHKTGRVDGADGTAFSARRAPSNFVGCEQHSALARASQRQRRGQSGEPGADDADGGLVVFSQWWVRGGGGDRLAIVIACVIGHGFARGDRPRASGRWMK